MHREHSDEDLMLAYGNGDVRAFELIYQRHKGALYRYLLRQCGNTADAQELFQDVWANLIRARERYRAQARFTTYLFCLAHNRLVDHYRRQAHNPLSKASWSDPEDSGEDGDAGNMADVDAHALDDSLHVQRLTARLLELVGALPPVQREAFLLREEAGLSVEQIAEVTQVNPETAKSRLRYAVAKLRQGLRREFGE
jgi:RNA polymerase sigma-70 factor, ECF subfamily